MDNGKRKMENKDVKTKFSILHFAFSINKSLLASLSNNEARRAKRRTKHWQKKEYMK